MADGTTSQFSLDALISTAVNDELKRRLDVPIKAAVDAALANIDIATLLDLRLRETLRTEFNNALHTLLPRTGYTTTPTERALTDLLTQELTKYRKAMLEQFAKAVHDSAATIFTPPALGGPSQPPVKP